MPSIMSYLPPNDGILPYWLFIVSNLRIHQVSINMVKLSIVSIGNSIQAYTSLARTREVFSGPLPPGTKPSLVPANTSHLAHLSPITPIAARMFGTWTAVSSVVRLYAAYNIHDKNLYELAMATYVIATWMFFSEWLVYGTARWTRGLAGPVIIAPVGLTWMIVQYGYYVR
jgi:hypothetical protein